MKKKSKILLFDGNNLIFRSFHAIKELSTTNGIATNAVYGVLKSFKSTIQLFSPEYVVVCWDSGKKTFRHEQDITYKANRMPVKDDLKIQFPIVKEAFDILQVPQITADGVESDDLIGTIATKASLMGLDVVIISSDKDFFQLCSNNIQVYSYTVRNKNGDGMVNVDYVRENFGVEPYQLVDIKSLTGERTDNIQGVKGIGPKIATKLVKNYGNVFEVLKVLKTNSTIPEKYKAILDNIDIIINAYKLAKIKIDVELPEIPIMPVENVIFDEKSLEDFFKKYQMNYFLNEFGSWKRLFKYKTTLV